MNRILFILLASCQSALLLIPLSSSNAQLISTHFGENRLQYEQYKWERYESPNFIFSFTKEKKIIDLGPLEVNKKENKTIGWPVYAGIGVGLFGIALIALDKKEK